MEKTNKKEEVSKEKVISNVENNKKAIDFVFNENPELEKIGTKEEYLKYVNNFFPNSNCKEIFYHGTASKNLVEDFDFNKSNFANAVFFTNNFDFAKSFAFDDIRDGHVQAQVLNIKNTFDFQNENHIEDLRPIIMRLVEENYTGNNTGISFTNNLDKIFDGTKDILNPKTEDFVNHYMWRLKNGSWRIIETDKVMDFISKKYDSFKVNERGGENIAVFNKESYLVLGSKKDLESFRNYKKSLEDKYKV